MIQQISDAELDIMKIIWANGEPTLFAFLMEELEAAGKTWRKNTVITLLSRLMEKGFLKATKTGRRNEYTPLVSEAEYQKCRTRSFLDRIYGGNVKGLVANLIESDFLTDSEYEELRNMIEGREISE